MESDILTEISHDKYSEVLETLKRDWPDSIHIYYFIRNFIDWREKTDSKEMKVFCPDNNIKDGVVIVILTCKVRGYKITICHCVDESGLKKLEEVLRVTCMIDWTQVQIFEGSHEKIVPILEAIFVEKNLEYDKTGYHQVWLTPDKSKNIYLEDLSFDGLELRDLKEHHSGIINKTWAYSGFGTEEQIKNSIVMNGGIGLFPKGKDSPIAWCTIVHFYGLGTLYTLDEYRQKGYASIVTKALSKKLAERGIDPWACIQYDNVPSLSMFTKLGFEKVCMVYWGIVKPRTQPIQL